MTDTPWTDPAVIAHGLLLDGSHRHWLGRPLLEGDFSPEGLARALYEAPFVLVSHGTEADPLFNYANRAAQALWELDWDRFVGMPSRRSAEAVERAERAEALGVASKAGYIAGYRGVRISASGRRFLIPDALIWNLLDNSGAYRGQAARFDRWEYV